MKRLLFPIRIARLSFLSRSIAAIAFDMLATHFSYLLPLSLSLDGWVILSYSLSLVLFSTWMFAAVVPRCRDAGLSPWRSLSLFLPIWNVIFLVLLFVMKSSNLSGLKEPIQLPEPTAGLAPGRGSS